MRGRVRLLGEGRLLSLIEFGTGFLLLLSLCDLQMSRQLRILSLFVAGIGG